MRKQGQYSLHKLDPLSKLITLFCIAMLAMHWDKPLPLCGLLLLLTVSALSGAGMSWGRLASRMGYIVVFGLPLFVLTTLAAPGEENIGRWAEFASRLKRFYMRRRLRSGCSACLFRR